MNIETERLLLRRWQLADTEDLYDYAKSPNVGPNAGWKPHESVAESQIIVEMFMKGNERAIVDKASGKVIGSFGIMKDWKRKVEGAFMIGYVLAEEYWGKGLMSEAVRAVIPHVFEDLNAQILSVGHFPFNLRSKRVIEKAGFVFEGILRFAYPVYNGEIYDEVCYSMRKEEFEELKAKGHFANK